MSDEARIAEIRARLEAATLGPWKADFEGTVAPAVLDAGDDAVAECFTDQDAALIAAAPADLAWLCARVEALRGALEPFAETAASYDPPEGDDKDVAWAHDFPIGALRRARAALEGEP